MQMQYHDVEPRLKAEGYAATNEEPEIFNELLGMRRFNLTGGICSAGEIPLRVLAPRSGRVIAIDHSMRSLCVTALKGEMLTSKPQEFMQLMKDGYSYASEKRLKALIEEVKPLLHPDLQDPIRTSSSLYSSGPSYPPLHESQVITLAREWEKTEETQLRMIIKAVQRIELRHTDIRDVSELFGCFYVSNCMEHASSKDKSHPTMKDFGERVKPGGYLIGAGYLKGCDLGPFELVNTIRGRRTGWEHWLMKKVR